MVSFKMRLKNLGQTPRKVGEVSALIRRRSIDEALVILDHTPRRAAGALTKLLKTPGRLPAVNTASRRTAS